MTDGETVALAPSSMLVGEPVRRPSIDETSQDLLPTDPAVLPPKALKTFSLVALIFFNVSGGPYGSEGLIKSGGAWYTFLGFMIVPVVWCIPVSLMTAELSTAFPTNGGSTIWVKNGLGNFMGFQQGWWTWCSGVVDNALYPALFLDYVSELTDLPFNDWQLLLLKIGFSILLTLFAIRGLEIVGVGSFIVNILVLSPFAILTIWGLFEMDTANWRTTPENGIQWSLFINLILWNLNSWESVGTLSGEVSNPQKTFPRALGISVVLIVFSYLLPLMVGVGIAGNLEEWEEGYFSNVAEQLGGRPLGVFLLIGAALSCTGLFLAEMVSDAYQLYGMAKWGMLPAVFARVSRYDTPYVAILASLLVVGSLAVLPFEAILEIDNILYSASLIAECVTMITLRFRAPHLRRPYRVPLNKWLLLVWMLCPVALGIFAMAMSSLLSVLISLGAIIMGLGLYFLVGFLRQREVLKFYADRANPYEY